MSQKLCQDYSQRFQNSRFQDPESVGLKMATSWWNGFLRASSLGAGTTWTPYWPLTQEVFIFGRSTSVGTNEVQLGPLPNVPDLKRPSVGGKAFLRALFVWAWPTMTLGFTLRITSNYLYDKRTGHCWFSESWMANSRWKVLFEGLVRGAPNDHDH